MTALPDPTGRILTEIRDDATVAAITARVRPEQPAGKTEADAGDARGPGQYVPFVVVSRLGHARGKRIPTQEVRLLAKCYGTTAQNAAALAAAVSGAVHARGHRISSAGVAISGSFDDGGAGLAFDPVTGQPHEDVVIQVNASTRLIT